ncbi:MAG: MATE family efflux transporter [Myxococcota bacterium]
MSVSHFSKGGALRDIIRLALPLVVVQVSYHLVGFVDTVIAGRHSDLALAATGLGASVFFAFTVVGVGLSWGLDPIAAQAFGAGQPDRARRALWQGIYGALIASLPLTLCGIVVAEHLELLGVNAALAEQARLYIYARLPSVFPMLCAVTLRAYLQASHRTRPIVWSALLMNVANALADWVLLFGDSGLEDLGLPSMGLTGFGVVGIGWASVVASLVQVGVLIHATWRMTPKMPASVRRLHMPF